MIEGGIEVAWVAHSATVESVDGAARTVSLSVRGVPVPDCKIGRGVSNWSEIRVGDRVRATIEEVLTVYLASTNESGRPDARVLIVDPSYRVLTVLYPNGETQAFKIGLQARMEGIEAGDSVAIRPVEVTKLRVRHHSNREVSSLPRRSATAAR